MRPLHVLTALRLLLSRPAVGVAALLAVPSAVAQPALVWTPLAALNATLPAGIRVFETSTPVLRAGRNEPLRAWLVRLDTTGASWRLGARLSDEGGETTARFAQEPGVRLALNAGFFGSGVSYSLVMDDGVLRASNLAQFSRPAGAYYPTRGAFGVLAGGALDVAWVYNVDGVTTAYPNPSPNTPTVPQPRPTATFPAGGAP